MCCFFIKKKKVECDSELSMIQCFAKGELCRSLHTRLWGCTVTVQSVFQIPTLPKSQNFVGKGIISNIIGWLPILIHITLPEWPLVRSSLAFSWGNLKQKAFQRDSTGINQSPSKDRRHLPSPPRLSAPPASTTLSCCSCSKAILIFSNY